MMINLKKTGNWHIIGYIILRSKIKHIFYLFYYFPGMSLITKSMKGLFQYYVKLKKTDCNHICLYENISSNLTWISIAFNFYNLEVIKKSPALMLTETLLIFKAVKKFRMELHKSCITNLWVIKFH